MTARLGWSIPLVLQCSLVFTVYRFVVYSVVTTSRFVLNSVVPTPWFVVYSVVTTHRFARCGDYTSVCRLPGKTCELLTLSLWRWRPV